MWCAKRRYINIFIIYLYIHVHKYILTYAHLAVNQISSVPKPEKEIGEEKKNNIYELQCDKSFHTQTP